MSKLSYAERMRANGKFPIVLRLEAVSPADISGIVGHAERRIGDVSHTDPGRRELNEILIGSHDIERSISAQCEEMKAFNHRSNLDGLRDLSRHKEAARIEARGPSDPWVASKNSAGPLREGIMSVHRDFFRASDDCPTEFILEFLDDEGDLARHDVRKHQEFKDHGTEFLRREYGDACVYARYDLDEQSGHFHFLIVDRVFEPAAEKTARYKNGRWLYRTTNHRTIGGISGDPRRGYEVAQDVVAEFFAEPPRRHLNICRGEDRARQRREADEAVAQMVEKQEIREMMSGRRVESLDGSGTIRRSNSDKMPAGSRKAQIAWLLKKQEREAASRSGKLRTDDRQQLALDGNPPRG